MSLSSRVALAIDRVRYRHGPRVVVTGMPKSGTTALAMIMGGAAGLSVSNDPFHALAIRGHDVRTGLYDASLRLERVVAMHPARFCRGLVKDPSFIFWTDQLRTAFPRAGVVCIVRDPRANIRSILNRLGLPGRPSEAPEDLSHLPPIWRQVLSGHTPEVPGEDYVERLAARWVLCVRQLDAAPWIHRVRYEDFNTDKAGMVRAILSDLGVRARKPFEHLLDRQYQRRGNRSVGWEEFFGPETLHRIGEICAPAMAALGYDPERDRPA